MYTNTHTNIYAKIALLSFHYESRCAMTSFTLMKRSFSTRKNRPKQAGKSWDEKEDLRPLKYPQVKMRYACLPDIAYIRSLA